MPAVPAVVPHLVTSATNSRAGYAAPLPRLMMANMNGATSGPSSKYGPSPLATYDRALETATALLLLEVARPSINYELCRQHGFSEGQAAAVIRDAAALCPRPSRPIPVRRRS
jgi:hypothetical protein